MQPSSSQIKKHFAWSRRMKPFSKEICDQTKDKELIVYGTGAVGEVVTQALLKKRFSLIGQLFRRID